MAKINDLTTGPIFPALVKLSLPIIGTSFIQMAYSLTDVLWLGRAGSATVTAVTTAGFFLWLLMALAYSTKAGTETLVAQCVGKKEPDKAKKIAENALTLSLIGSCIAFVCIFIFAPQLLSFFELEAEVRSQAIAYLRVVSFGMCFSAMNPVLSAIYLGHGDSRTPFLVNSCGLIANIVLDPLLIFGLLGFPELGATGAAIATVFANILVFIIFLIKQQKDYSVYSAPETPGLAPKEHSTFHPENWCTDFGQPCRLLSVFHVYRQNCIRLRYDSFGSAKYRGKH